MKVTINQLQTGLYFRNGTFVERRGSGVYHIYGFRNETIELYPLTPQYSIQNISATSADGSNFIVTLYFEVTIADALAYYNTGKSYDSILAITVAPVIQDYFAKRDLADALTSTGDALAALDIDSFTTYGLSVSVVRKPEIRLPRNLQNAIDAQEVARQRAKADLEEARGRTAVLRHYANAANLAKDKPELLQLLIGQKAKAVNISFDTERKR